MWEKKLKVVLAIVFVLNVIQSWTLSEAKKSPPRIGIIGGGIGGSSAAYFIHELLPSASIHIFEKTGILGGRLNLTMINGNGYETGGSIIHSKNKYAVDFAKQFDLEPKTDSGATLSVIKDDEYVFNTSKWTLITIIRTLARYGFNFNRLESLISGFMDKFARIYDFQKEGKSFEHPEQMLEAMDPQLLNLTYYSLRNILKEDGYAENFMDELVQAITFVNYGQDMNIHGFVGSVSVAGAGSELWCVWKGNKQLPENLAKNSNAKVHLNTEVREIIKQQDGTYSFSDGKRDLGVFDHIVVAIPLDASEKLIFENFEKPPYEYPKARKYHRTVTTIVAGWPHDKYKFRTAIISCVPHWYNSISIIFPTVLLVSEKYPVYKIFSNKPLTEKQLDSIFAERHHVEVHDWLAYPEYDQIPPKMPSFVLAPKLYYLNAIEWAASAMEMSVISGKNIALLIAQNENAV